MLKIEANNLGEAIKKAYTLGKIEAMEMVAEMVESGMVSNMDNVHSMVRAIRRNCEEQKKEVAEDTSDAFSKEDAPITKDDINELIKDIKNI